MGVDRKGGRHCDECGRSMLKAHRIHKGSEYCGTCYKRLFIPKDCAHCTKATRVHRNAIEPPVCRSCLIARRTCLRCRKAVPRAGLIVDGRAVCGACAPYFRDKTPCAHCGQLSSRLSTAPNHGVHEKICDQCRNKLTHRTCSVCGRYRPVVGFTSDDDPYCKACVPESPTSHLCPNCGDTVHGSGSGKCSSCLVRGRIRREAALLSLTLNHDWARDLYVQFAEWLCSRESTSIGLVAAFAAHLPFFERLDVTFANLALVTDKSLLQHFGAAKLREHLLAARFLEEVHVVRIDEADKAESAELNRIAEKLLSTRNESWGTDLKEYVAWLKGTATPTRTIRLYLTAAAKFCAFCKNNASAFTGEDIHQFLRRHSGSRASLFKWVSFSRSMKGRDVYMPTLTRPATTTPRTVPQLAKLLRKINETGVVDAPLELLARTIAKALGYTARKMTSFDWQLSETSEGMFIAIGGEAHHVPPALAPIVQQWFLRHTATTANEINTRTIN